MNESNMDDPRWECICNGKRGLDVFWERKLPVIQIKEVHRPDMVDFGRDLEFLRPVIIVDVSVFGVCKIWVASWESGCYTKINTFIKYWRQDGQEKWDKHGSQEKEPEPRFSLYMQPWNRVESGYILCHADEFAHSDADHKGTDWRWTCWGKWRIPVNGRKKGKSVVSGRKCKAGSRAGYYKKSYQFSALQSYRRDIKAWPCL